MFIVVDIDGTIADNSHRQHLIERKTDAFGQKIGPPPNWDQFFLECGGDAPIHHVIEVVHALHEAGNVISFWSGRSEDVYDLTFNWLFEHGLTFDYDKTGAELSRPVFLRHRPSGDYTPDEELKRRWLNEERKLGRQPHLVLDDRQKVVDMWREEGIPCMQVAPGDF